MTRSAILLTLALAACKDGSVGIDETDTDVTVDTDETDVPIDTTDTFEVSGTLHVDADQPVDGDVQVVMVGTIFDESGELGSGGFDTVWATADATELDGNGDLSFTFHLPLEPGDEQFAAPDTADGSMEIAGWMVGAYVDQDSSGGPSSGDLYVSSGGPLIVNLRGELSDDAIEVGAELGYNLFVLDFTGGDGDVVPIQDLYDGYVLEANLAPHDRGDLELHVEDDLGATVTVGLVVPLDEDIGATLNSVELDANQAGADATLTWPFPDADWLLEPIDGSQDRGLEGAYFVALAWTDTDENGAYDEGEQPWASSYASSSASLCAYYKATSFEGGFYAQAFGVPMGWSLLEGEGIERDWDEGMSLGTEF